MTKLNSSDLESYILGLVNQDNWQDDKKDPRPVIVRKNEANSKWLSRVASSRNIVWYKAITMVSFLSYTNKESIIFFRMMTAEAVGASGIAFKPSPGNWYLNNKDKYKTCLLSEFVNTVNNLYSNELVPEEMYLLTKEFIIIDKLSENATHAARVNWKDCYNKIHSFLKESSGDEYEHLSKVLDAVDKKIKKDFNNSAYLRRLGDMKGNIDKWSSATDFSYKRIEDIVTKFFIPEAKITKSLTNIISKSRSKTMNKILGNKEVIGRVIKTAIKYGKYFI